MADRYRREQDRDQAVAVLECRDCGVMVVDVEAHDRFHAAADSPATVQGGAMLSAEELADIREWVQVRFGVHDRGRLVSLLAHIDAQAAEMEALRAEVRRFWEHQPHTDVMWSELDNPYREEYPLIAALLRYEGT